MGLFQFNSGSGIVRGTTGTDEFSYNGPDVWSTGIITTLFGGAGDDVYHVTRDTVVIELPGEGLDTITAPGSYALPDNVEQLFVSGSFSAVGNDLNNLLVGGSGATFMNGGRGNDTLRGGGGADTYQFDANSGHDIVETWNSASRVRLAGYDQFDTFAQVKSAMQQVGSDVVLQLDASNDVIFKNSTLADFNAGNFQYRMNWSDYSLTLKFNDDFNSFTLNNPSHGTTGLWSAWGVGDDRVTEHTLQSNGERQLYVDPTFKGQGGVERGLNPFSLDNGALVITASPVAAADKQALYGYDFQSGGINTRDTFAQTYGYFEARMMLPTAKGTWPAFWLMRTDGIWPPELDIMEAWNDTSAVQTVHTNELMRHTQTSSTTYIADGDTAFHNYGLLWTPEKLTWYLDGVEVFSQDTPADMHSPMYMILNLAVSGAVDDPNFTEQFKIDYVKAYSLDSLPVSVGSDGYGAVAGKPDGFNVDFYRMMYPDVANGGLDPLFHYLRWGKAEGRLAYEGATPSTTGNIIGHVPTNPYMGAISGLPDGFNPDYYAAQNPDVVASKIDLLKHWLTWGKAEGRLPYDPNDIASATHDVYLGPRSDSEYGFNYAYYAEHNPDVWKSGMGLYDHYLSYGITEGRLAYDPGSDTGIGSGTVTPVETVPVVATPVVTTPVATTPSPSASVGSDAVAHAYWGKVDGLQNGFNQAFYAAKNPDVVASGMNLYDHYQRYGVFEGRAAYDATDTSTPAWGAVTVMPHGFNAAYYVAHNPDIGTLDPLFHYQNWGRAEGRLAYDPTMPVVTDAVATNSFDPIYYALHNPDVVASGLDLKYHFDTWGKAEGRLAYDNGSGREDLIGTAGNDVLTDPGAASSIKVLTGGAGADTFVFKAGSGWDVITDFKSGEDTLDLSSLFATGNKVVVSDLSWASGSMITVGNDHVVLMGVSAMDASKLVVGA